MNINEAFPSNFLKADDLQGREAKVTMARVNMEDIGGDHKPVLYFQGKEKGMVLNKTNSTNIASAYGPETDGWTGKEVILYSAWVDFQGKSVKAIRIRPPENSDYQKAPDPAQQGPQSHAPDPDDAIPFAPDR